MLERGVCQQLDVAHRRNIVFLQCCWISRTLPPASLHIVLDKLFYPVLNSKILAGNLYPQFLVQFLTQSNVNHFRLRMGRFFSGSLLIKYYRRYFNTFARKDQGESIDLWFVASPRLLSYSSYRYSMLLLSNNFH